MMGNTCTRLWTEQMTDFRAHRGEEVVKELVLTLLEDYARDTENSVDNYLVSKVREALYTNPTVGIHFTGYEDCP